MKKIFFGMAALVAMVATSCQQTPDLEEVGVVGGNLTTVSFNLGTPQIANRANYSTGETATHLQYAVYNADGQILNDLTVTNAEIHGSTNVEFQLTTGNTYFVLFWASAYAADDTTAPYQVNLENKTLTVSYSGAVSNDEKRDAFYYYDDFTVVSGMDPINADLKRPFAQLNIGTSDFAKSASAGHTVSHAKVETLAYTGLDFSTGAVTGEKVAVTFGYAAVPGNTYEFPVEDDIYDYVAMNYLLMGTTKEPIDVKFSYATGYDSTTGVATNEKTRTVGSAPFARNHRTNLYGQLFTSNTKVNVEIMPEFEGEYVKTLPLSYDAATNTFEVHGTEGLLQVIKWSNDATARAEALQSVLGGDSDANLETFEGMTIKLLSDIDLNVGSANGEPISVEPICNGGAFKGTLDGNGYTIANLY
ncbi:MAG: hypothetical protein IJ014_02680, partial [Rikenellaceae bacterium]|nr:hypothetical protein [Rikenellaceae bacterium]